MSCLKQFTLVAVLRLLGSLFQVQGLTYNRPSWCGTSGSIFDVFKSSCDSSACGVSIRQTMSYDIEWPRRSEIFIGFSMPVRLCNPKPNEVCFNVAYFLLEIANIMSEQNESTKRVYVSDLFLDNNNVS